MVVRIARINAIEVVVGRTRPQSGQAHVFVELIGSGDSRGVGIHNGGTAGLVGQGHALNAHAELQVGIRHSPVNIGTLDLDDVGTVGAQSAALIGFAPGLIADFKENRAGQGFGSHGVQLQTHALLRAELIRSVLGFDVTFTMLVNRVGFRHAKTHQPLAFGLEINGAGARGRAQQHARRQQKRTNTFHVFSFLSFEPCKRLKKLSCPTQVLTCLSAFDAESKIFVKKFLPPQCEMNPNLPQGVDFSKHPDRSV